MNDTVAMFMLQDMWSMFLAFCGAICTISAAVVIVIKIVEKIRKPNKDQNDRIEKLEKSVEKMREQMEKDSRRITDAEIHFKGGVNVVIESLQALTAHAIDGNNIEELKVSKKRLDSYLINR